MGTVTSPAPELAIPKATSLLLGLAVMVAVDRVVTTRNRLWAAAGVCVAVGILATIVGSLSATWQWKFAGLGPLAQSMPRGLAGLPGAEGGVNSNALGAAIILVLPGLAIPLVGSVSEGVLPVTGLGQRMLWFFRLVAWSLVGGLLYVLLLSQSRSAWLALLIVIGIYGALSARRMAVALGGFATAILACTLVFGLDYVTTSVELSVRRLGLAGEHFRVQPAERVRIWNLALSELYESPVKGIGLGSFRHTVRDRLSADESIPVHAHNVFIQIALDVGLVGLVAYCIVMTIGILSSWQSFVHAEPTIGWIALGMGGNILAVHIFGIVDAVALGAKLGGILWASLAIVMASRNLSAQT